jgi:hypothetical protein
MINQSKKDECSLSEIIDIKVQCDDCIKLESSAEKSQTYQFKADGKTLIIEN